WMARSGVDNAPREIPMSARGMDVFDRYMVNLADGGGISFLRVSLQQVVAEPAAAAHVAETPEVIPRIRTDVLEQLTEQTGASLVTPEGKAALKEAIRARAAASLEGREVIDVLFSEFVVQF